MQEASGCMRHTLPSRSWRKREPEQQGARFIVFTRLGEYVPLRGGYSVSGGGAI